MRYVLSALLLSFSFTCSISASEPIAFTVASGKHDRLNEPTCIPLQFKDKLPLNTRVEIQDEKGQTVALGQLTPPDLITESIQAKTGVTRLDLNFVLPELKAGKELSLKAVFGASAKSDQTFSLHRETTNTDHWTELRLGKRPILRYVHTPLDESSKAARDRTFKVFHHVYDLAGEKVITNGPSGRFPHHRGLFYGFMRTSYGKNVVDVWHCKGDAHQAHAGEISAVAGPVLGRHVVEIDWNGVGKKTFAKELRELTVFNVPGGTLIDFASKLTPTGGPVKLDGDPQHAGFHFRADNAVAEKTAKQTIFIRPDGTDKPGATRNWDGKKNRSHVNLPWLAMSFVLDGKRYSVAYLDRPQNPKEARFSERDYGRFGSYFVTTVTKENPLLVRYRVWIQEGLMTPNEVKARSIAFVDPVRVRRK